MTRRLPRIGRPTPGAGRPARRPQRAGRADRLRPVSRDLAQCLQAGDRVATTAVAALVASGRELAVLGHPLCRPRRALIGCARRRGLVEDFSIRHTSACNRLAFAKRRTSLPMPLVPARPGGDAPVLVTSDDLPTWGGAQPAVQAWIAANGFDAALGSALVLPGADGTVETVPVGWAAPRAARGVASIWRPRWPAAGRELRDRAAGHGFRRRDRGAGWLLSEYRFERYRKAGPATRRPDLSGWRRPGAVAIEPPRRRSAVDLINIPANDLGPADLSAPSGARRRAGGRGAGDPRCGAARPGLR